MATKQKTKRTAATKEAPSAEETAREYSPPAPAPHGRCTTCGRPFEAAANSGCNARCPVPEHS